MSTQLDIHDSNQLFSHHFMHPICLSIGKQWMSLKELPVQLNCHHLEGFNVLGVDLPLMVSKRTQPHLRRSIEDSFMWSFIADRVTCSTLVKLPLQLQQMPKETDMSLKRQGLLAALAAQMLPMWQCLGALQQLLFASSVPALVWTWQLWSQHYLIVHITCACQQACNHPEATTSLCFLEDSTWTG